MLDPPAIAFGALVALFFVSARVFGPCQSNGRPLGIGEDDDDVMDDHAGCPSHQERPWLLRGHARVARL